MMEGKGMGIRERESSESASVEREREKKGMRQTILRCVVVYVRSTQVNSRLVLVTLPVLDWLFYLFPKIPIYPRKNYSYTPP